MSQSIDGGGQPMPKTLHIDVMGSMPSMNSWGITTLARSVGGGCARAPVENAEASWKSAEMMRRSVHEAVDAIVDEVVAMPMD